MTTNGTAQPGAPQTGEAFVAKSAAGSSTRTDAEITALAKGMQKYLREGFIPELIEKHIEPLLKTRTRRLEERVRELEERPLLEDCGIWNKRTDYHPGNVVTHDGSSWVAKTWHRAGEPGKCDDWRLLVKRGRDGRDAR